MRTCIRLILITVSALALPAFAKADSCAKLVFKSALTCEALRAELDVSGCNDLLMQKLKIACMKDEAIITAIGQKNHYSTSISLNSGTAAAVAVVPNQAVDTRTPFAAKAEPAAAQPAPVGTHAITAEKMEHPTEAHLKPATEEGDNSSKPSAEGKSNPEAAEHGAWSSTALFDGYYAYNFNHPAPTTPLSASSVDAAAIRPPQNALRSYDWYSRQFGLNLVEFSPKYKRGEVTFFADLDFGQMADINASIPSQSGYAVDEVSKHIGQAILSYTPAGAPKFLIEVGKMATHLGLEGIKAKENWNYSRSVNYAFGVPIWHTGIHVAYSIVPKQVVASVYLYNGWNTLTDVNSAPTLGGQLKYTPSETTTLIYNYIGGAEQPANNSNLKQVHEANATFNVASHLSLGMELLTGSEQGATFSTGTGRATWSGASLATRWKVSPTYALTPRVEVYRDRQGYTTGGDAQTISTGTLTNSFVLTEGLETRIEGRLDHSTSARFLSRGSPSQNQATALVAFLYTIE